MLADFLSIESSEVVTMHMQSVDQTEAVKKVKHTITELDRSKIEEQKKAVRSGYDMDIIPSDLATYGNDAKALLWTGPRSKNRRRRSAPATTWILSRRISQPMAMTPRRCSRNCIPAACA